MEIKIIYHEPGLHKLEQLAVGDWIDLRAAEEVTLKAGDHRYISLGVSMQLPDGYEAHVAPRSSSFRNWGILQTNSVGIVDHSYCGTNDIWKYPVYATRDTVIHKNDRICQFRIIASMPTLTFREVDALDSTDRGGFGITGIS